MGYTHHWHFHKKAENIENVQEKFSQAVEMLKNGIAKIPSEIETTEYKNENGKLVPTTVKMPFKLCGGNGYGEPKFTDSVVCFNGDAENKHDYETCYLAVNDLQDYDFCKTGREIYDVAVCLTLLCFKDAFGEDFDYSSDGDIESGEEGWELAKEIFAELLAEDASAHADISAKEN